MEAASITSPGHSQNNEFTSNADMVDRQEHSWLQDNILNPAYNAAVVQPVNGLLSLSEHSKLAPAGEAFAQRMHVRPVEEAKTGTADWYAQNIASGAASLAPYIVAGKLAGRMLQAAGRGMALEGLAARVMASENTAQILGAVTFDGLTTPDHAKSRMAGTFTAFSVYQLSNGLSQDLPLLGRVMARAITGAAGAGAQISVSSLLSSDRLPDAEQFKAAALQGASLNVLLPTVQEGAQRVIDKVDRAAGNGIAVGRVAKLEGLTGQSPTLDRLIAAQPLLRVRDSNHGSSIDQTRGIISWDRANGPGELGHEINHKMLASSPDAAASFGAVKRLLNADNKETAGSVYLSRRLDQEVGARTTERQIALELGHTARAQRIELEPAKILAQTASNGQTYEQVFRSDWARSLQSKSSGKLLPVADYGVLSNEDIRDALRSGRIKIEPEPKASDYDSDSINVHLADVFTFPDEGQILDPAREAPRDIIAQWHTETKPDGVLLKPGQSVLAFTQEKFTLPSEPTPEWQGLPPVMGRIDTKSGLARLFLQNHQTAPNLHNGTTNRITLEILNASKNSIWLRPGMSIGQVFFHELTGSPIIDRQSSFHGQTAPNGLRLRA